MAVRNTDEPSTTTQPSIRPEDFSVPPPLLTTGRLDNLLFRSDTTSVPVWSVTTPNILSNENIRGDLQTQVGAPGHEQQSVPPQQPPRQGMSFSETAFAIGGILYTLRQVNQMIIDFYEHSVYMSDSRLVELGYRPEGFARQVWHWTSTGLETIWVPLRFRAENLRDQVVYDALDEQTIRQELTAYMQQEREERASFHTAASGTPTGTRFVNNFLKEMNGGLKLSQIALLLKE